MIYFPRRFLQTAGGFCCWITSSQRPFFLCYNVPIMKNYIVFDLSEPGIEGKEHSIEHFPFEIIEIGAVKLDERRNMVSEFHGLITPQVYVELHRKILEVTHMDMETLKREGRLFPEVIKEFLEWCGSRLPFLHLGCDGPDGTAAEYGVLPGGDSI